MESSSRWVCHIQQFFDERLLVFHFRELAFEIRHIALWRAQNSQKGEAVLYPVPANTPPEKEASRIRNAIDGEEALKSKYSVMKTMDGGVAVFHRTKIPSY